MTITAPTPISPLPPPPNPDDRTTFNALAYPWSVAQQTFATQAAALAANVYNNAVEIMEAYSAAMAAGLPEAEANALTATAQAEIATVGAEIVTALAGVVTTKAAEAAASAAAASAVTGLPLFTEADAGKAIVVNPAGNGYTLGAAGEKFVAASGAVTAKGNLVDTSAGPITLILPLSPVYGDFCKFTDVAGTFLSNPLTLDRNGSTIMGSATNLICDVRGISFALWYNGTDWRLI